MSYTDFVKLQNFVAHALLSDDDLSSVNIVTRERLLADESRLPDRTLAVEVLAYLTVRNGRKGCGVIVEKPEFQVGHPNLPGPEGDIVLTCLVLEDRITNSGPVTGTQRPADQVSQRLMEVLHGYQMEGFGQLFCDANAMLAATDFEPLVGYRCAFRLRMPRGQTARVEQPTISEESLSVTLACATEEAMIYFTTDGSFPGPSNPGATLYAGPFDVEEGDVINAAAFKAGLAPSHVIQATVTA